jgi:holo-[acyl-carrier protein] synthase
MIYGIGIDLVKIERLREVVGKWGERFLSKVYTCEEISYCFKKRQPYLSLAVRFAAKEAFIKALGSAITVSMREIEIFNSETGKPALKVTERIEKFFQEKFINAIHVSLSHEHEYGVAFVVLEQQK